MFHLTKLNLMIPIMNNLFKIFVFQFLFFLTNLSAEDNIPSVIVETEEAATIEISPSIWTSGSIISQNDSKIASEVKGKIIEILDVGEQVKKGDVIARIENTKYQLSYNEIKSEIEPIESLLIYYTSETERLKKLAGNNNAAKNELEKIQANKNESIAKINLIKSKLETARDLLDRTIIRAPFDGITVNRFKSIGEIVDPNDEIIRLVDIDNLEIKSHIQKKSLPYVNIGDALEIKIDSSSMMGVVNKLIPVGDNISRLYEIRVQFSNKIWPVGTAVKVACPIKQKQNVLVVPRDALVIRQSGIAIYRINTQDRAELIPVQTGISNTKYIQVIGDVSIGDEIVIRGNERLRPGQAVKIINNLDY